MPVPSWVEDLMDLFSSAYTDERGLMVIAIDGQGKISQGHPVIADFGDILPFLRHFGMHEFVDDQLDKAELCLRNGLYVRNNRVRLFLNHDWLLGLLDLYRQTGPALSVAGTALPPGTLITCQSGACVNPVSSSLSTAGHD